MNELKLIAMDSEDLAVISAHVQDAVAKIGDLVYDARAKRFAIVCNRFDWADAYSKPWLRWTRMLYQRRRAGLRFERVLAAKTKKINFEQPGEVVSLLAVTFQETEAPAGKIRLQFSDDASIELTVECIEAELRDLGAAWETSLRPVHRDNGKT